MLNVPELERRWKRYRRKRRTPYYLLFALSLLFAGGASYYYWQIASISAQNKVPKTHSVSSSSSSRALAVHETVPDRSEPKPSAPQPAKPPATAVNAKKEKHRVKLQPSMHFIDTFETSEEDDIDYYFAPAHQAVSKKTATTPKIRQVPAAIVQKPAEMPVKMEPRIKKEVLPAITKQTAQPQTVQNVEIKPVPSKQPIAKPSQRETSSKMVIQRESDMKDIQEVIARFKKNKNPALSLFVAKRYYAIGNYQQAYNYALITNEIDNSIEDSWLIFAKSLYKLGQKEMAMKTLQTYYDDSRSVKAKITLDKMKDGDFQ